MEGVLMDLATLRRKARSFGTILWRRFVCHRVDFVICGAAVKDHTPPAKPFALLIEVTPMDDAAELVAWSPYLSQRDVDDFRARGGAYTATIRDGHQLAAMNVFVRGPSTVRVEELRGVIPVEAGGHFSCRTYVDPQFRGQALFEQMIWAYAQTLDGDDRIWGLVLEQNQPSLRSLARNGWQDFGRWTATTRLGRHAMRRVNYDPRPIRWRDDRQAAAGDGDPRAGTGDR